MPIEMPAWLPFAVDTWGPSSSRRRHFFLTHAHCDHLVSAGANADGDGTIYATRLTHCLALRRIPQLGIWKFVEMEVGKTVVVDDPAGAFSVTAFDANHCPGALMFLFEGEFGSVLHTGDCRLTLDCVQNLPLNYLAKKGKQNVCLLDFVFLDCTFSECSLKLPSKESAIQQVIACIRKHPHAPFVYLACDMLGHEDILIEVSRTFGSKIYVDRKLNCFKAISLTAPEIITDDPSSCFQIVGLHQLYENASKKLEVARAKLQPEPLFIRPSTRWYASSSRNQKPCLTEAEQDEFGVWHICFSIHSSRDELEQALQLLQPQFVISTTPPCSAIELSYMDIIPLSQDRPGIYTCTICVRISRLWEFHGRNDEDPIKHLDLVLINQKGTPMYAEISPDAVPMLQPHLQENKIVTMKKVFIDKAKQSFKAVRTPYMIRLNKWTIVKEVDREPKDFPKYTFSLTPFSQIPQLENNNEYFIDVIGRITSLSDATPTSTASGIVRMKRIIHLVDTRGDKIEISLWGPRAEEFPGQQLIEESQRNHVIAIFVGTSVKFYTESAPFLSGTAACRWYINKPEIDEIAEFYTSIQHPSQPIQKMQLQTSNEAQNMIEQKTLFELRTIDTSKNLTKRFECTIIITKIPKNQSWWYKGCTKCYSATKYDRNLYVCKKEGHVSSQITYRYTMSLYATDGTSELEFMLFHDKAISLIGKTAYRLLKQNNKRGIPSEISTLIGEKITVVVKVYPSKSVDKRGSNNDNKEPIFNIVTIKKRHGKKLIPSLLQNEASAPNTIVDSLQLQSQPPLMPIENTKEHTQDLSIGPPSPHDFQLMEIDQPSVSISQKGGFPIENEFEKDLLHDTYQLALLTEKGKRKRN